MRCFREISDQEWQVIAPLFPNRESRRDKRGRPLTDTRAVLNGALWVLYTGQPWKSIPAQYPSYQTCHRRFRIWLEAGILGRLVGALPAPLARMLDDQVARRTGWRPSRLDEERRQARFDAGGTEDRVLVLPQRSL